MRKALLLLACSAALAGCGSTVQARPAADALGAAATDGLAPTNSGLGQSSSGPVEQPNAVASGAPRAVEVAPGSASGPVASPLGHAGTTANPAAASRPGNVPGVTTTTVNLGVEYISTQELAAFGDSAGVSGIGQTDMLRTYQAAAAAVNKAGGVAGGRKLVIVPRRRSTSESNAEAAQKTCAAFTEDNRVLLANLRLEQDSPGVPCLASRGVVSIGGAGVEGGSQRDFQRFGGKYVSPGTADTVSAARTYVQALLRQRFLTKNSKVGLLWFDFADFREAKDRGLIPALKSGGLGLTSQYSATFSGSASDLGQIAGQMQNAALQFRADGVDRVLTLDYQGTLQYFFMNTAESQGYRPKYGLATWSDAEFLRGNGSAAQLAGSTGIGWMPAYDLAVKQLPVDEPKRHCLADMKEAGMPALKAQGDTLLQLRACAEVFFAQRLLDTATDLSPAGLAAAAAALGGQPSYVGFAEHFGSSKLWGAGAYRDLAYDTSCSCFSYRGPNRTF